MSKINTKKIYCCERAGDCEGDRKGTRGVGNGGGDGEGVMEEGGKAIERRKEE